ncbi:MAG: PD-(D/E)XK nuclease family protein [Bacillota bacterium]|nr:PD-(D/E)XK nuclease family protein [Bacillota bacterium]
MGLDQSHVAQVAAAVREGREEKVFYVLPTHRLQALARERVLAADGVAGARRLNILSFYQFVLHLLTVAGIRREALSDALRRFILRHLVEREAAAGRLTHFSALASCEGLASGLSRLVGELKLAGVTPAALAAAGVEEAKASAVRDIAHLYGCYQEFLSSRALADKEELQLLALQALRENPALLAGDTLLVEGFFDLTPVQADIIQEAQGRAAWCSVVPLGPAESTGELAGRITLARASSPEQEARLVAKEVKRLILQEGVAPAEIAVLTAGSRSTVALFAAVLAEEGVPTDLGGEAPLADTPLVRAILLCLETALALEGRFDLLRLVRSAYLPGGEEELVALRRAFRERGLTLTRPQWERRLQAALAREERLLAATAGEETAGNEAAIRRRLDGLRRAIALLPTILDPLATLPRRAPLAAHLQALEELLGRVGLEAAALSPAVPEELRVRDWTALGAFRQTLGELARAGDLLPEAGELTLLEFLSVLQAALSEASFRVEAAAPGGVALMTATQARGLTFRHAFFTGLVDGALPRSRREDWLLPESVREALKAQGLRLETVREAAERDRLIFRVGVSRATDHLHLSYAEADERGQAQLASPLLTDFCRAEAGRLEERASPSPLDVSGGWLEVTNFRELAGRVWRGLRACYIESAAAVEEPLVFQAASFLRAAVPETWSHVRYAATAVAHREQGGSHRWAGQVENSAALDNLAIARGPDFAWSAGRFWDYNRCPFRYFLQRELLAPAIEEAAEDFTPLEHGNLIHELLCRYYREGGEQCLTWAEPVREAAVRALVEEALSRSPVRDLVPHQAFWEARREAIVAQLLAALARDADCYRATGFRPRHLEWGFGLAPGRALDPASTLEPLRLRAGGEEVTVAGKVDRVDVDREGRFVVYDYKTGKIPGWSEEEAGRSLQLRLYLLAVKQLLLPHLRPAGAAYYQVKPTECKAKEGLWHRDEAAELVRFNRRRAGLFAAERWEALLTETAASAASVARRIRKGSFPPAANPDECWPCRYRTACRIDERSVGEEDEP